MKNRDMSALRPLQRKEYPGITRGTTQRHALSWDYPGVIAPLCDGPVTCAMIEQILWFLLSQRPPVPGPRHTCDDPDMYEDPQSYGNWISHSQALFGVTPSPKLCMSPRLDPYNLQRNIPPECSLRLVMKTIFNQFARWPIYLDNVSLLCCLRWGEPCEIP